jgi:iron(III) transport system ATP-binding protein
MSDTRSPAVEIRRLTLRYDGAPVVREVDLEVARGSLTALLGPSGCGKTTLLRAIAGFERPLGGSIAIHGEPVAAAGRWVPPERRRVTMVFQDGALFPHMTVRRNVGYGVRRHPDGESLVRRVLEMTGLEPLAGRYPDELSGGQQQRVALARALAPQPRVVLLDEPFAALDAALRERLRREVREVLRAAGATAILVTHDQEEALSVADRLAAMRQGRILQVGTPEEIYRRPASVAVAEILGGGRLLAATVEGGSCRSILGRAACPGPDGPGRLLVRAEDLEELPADASAGVEATIAERRFFGHDVLDCVRRAGGEELEVRVLSGELAAVGSRIRLALRPGGGHLIREEAPG